MNKKAGSQQVHVCVGGGEMMKKRRDGIPEAEQHVAEGLNTNTRDELSLPRGSTIGGMNE